MQNGNHVALHEKLMAVRLNCSFGLTNRVTDKEITQELNAQKGTKSLLVKKERFPDDSGRYLTTLHSVLAKFYSYHTKVTMSSVNKGEMLLPVAFYLDYMQEYSTAAPLIDAAYQDFEDNYDLSVQVAQIRLGPAFNAANYPKKEDLRRLLKFKVQTLPLPKADTLLSVVGESVQADVDAYLQEAMDSALSDVNTRIKDALERMVEQLGNPKGKIYDTLTGSLLELVSFVPTFNVVEDASLNLLAEEIKAKLLVHNTDALHDPAIRQDVAAQAADILRRMA